MSSRSDIAAGPEAKDGKTPSARSEPASRPTHAIAIAAALRQKGWTRVHLARLTGYDERTIRNVLAGQKVRAQTVHDICQALGIAVQPPAPEAVEIAAERLGGYTRPHVEAMIGLRSACRRSFRSPGGLIRTVFELSWSPELPGLAFREHQRYRLEGRVIDHSQSGEVHVSAVTDLVHLLTLDRGAVRTITLTKPKMIEPVMRGVMVTQSERTMFFQPAVSPVLMEPLGPAMTLAAALELVGPIEPGDPDFAPVHAALESVEREVVLFAGRAR